MRGSAVGSLYIRSQYTSLVLPETGFHRHDFIPPNRFTYCALLGYLSRRCTIHCKYNIWRILKLVLLLTMSFSFYTLSDPLRWRGLMYFVETNVLQQDIVDYAC